jgi:CheY-like chemotaxis protein
MHKRRILVVDDEMYVTQILAFNLRRAGDEVLTADDGEQALGLAEEHLPDLIIADYQMPRLDGLGMCIRLRQDPRTANIPILMLTARKHRLNPEDLARAGVQFVLAKPFSARELMARVEELIGPSSGAAMPALRGDSAAVA